MGVNQVIYAGETLIDLTGDTVTSETLVEGATAHDASGEIIEGTFKPLYVGDDTVESEVPINAETFNGYSLSDFLSLIYPVGSSYITSENVSPATRLGGTWALCGKGFRDEAGSLSDGTAFTASNVSSHDLLYVRSGNTLRVRLKAIPSVAISDTAVALGSINYRALGATQIGVTMSYLIGASDVGKACVVATMNFSSGSIEVVDTIAAESVAIGADVYFDITIPLKYEWMLDNFCDKFYWKRTA